MDKDINAIGIVRQMIADGQVSQEVAEKYFPELKESEMIRQLLMRFVKYDMPDNYSDDFSKEDCLDWLEKQCEKGTNGNNMEIPNSEQNPADKVEPKFNDGDWIIDVQGVSVNQIIGREDDSYHIKTSSSEFYLPMKLAEKNYRLWTIADAKDGDVLADNFGVILFRKIGNEKYADAVDYHCAVFKSGGFVIQKGVSYWGLSKEEELRPTTLEQRVRFFDAMGEAGYAWDAVKKELKKIELESQSIWKPSDEQMKALDFYIKTYVDIEGCYGSEVLELYEQLKKLREG